VDARHLETVPLFRDLSVHDREKIARWADEVDVPVGKHLLDQGRLPHEFFVILEGKVRVTKDGEHLAVLGPGDFFGEIALLEHQRRTASVVATEPTRLVVMHSRDFGAMEAELPSVAEQVKEAVRQRRARG